MPAINFPHALSNAFQFPLPDIHDSDPIPDILQALAIAYEQNSFSVSALHTVGSNLIRWGRKNSPPANFERTLDGDRFALPPSPNLGFQMTSVPYTNPGSLLYDYHLSNFL